jgi:hypothetical protein
LVVGGMGSVGELFLHAVASDKIRQASVRTMIVLFFISDLPPIVYFIIYIIIWGQVPNYSQFLYGMHC